jgi:hypothetical protein
MVVGDRLYFYFGAWSAETKKTRTCKFAPACSTVYAGGSTGVAMLRRDGFASMDAGKTPGVPTTTAISFKGRYPFVNVEAKAGELRGEVLDTDGRVIAPFSLANCVPVKPKFLSLP